MCERIGEIKMVKWRTVERFILAISLVTAIGLLFHKQVTTGQNLIFQMGICSMALATVLAWLK